MRQLRWVVLVVLLCASLSSAWGQGGASWVYVSGSGGVILRVTSSGGITTLVPASSAAYEGLVVGPDTNHGFLLYACDPTHNAIIRFDPENTASGFETVYQGTAASALQQPQCGRFTNTGDLIVTSKAAGSGAWEFAGVANSPLNPSNTLGFPATQNPPNGVLSQNSRTQVSQGIAQKNIGDLLIVDTTNKEVIRSRYVPLSPLPPTPPFSGPPEVFIAPSSSLLPSPFGIARQSAGEIYISNQSKKNQIVHFNAQGGGGSACINTLGSNITPEFMQMSADDTLYVAASSAHGAVFSVNTTSCTATQIPTGNALPALTGIALPPTSVTQTKTFTGVGTFNFGFTAYQFTSPAPGCTLTVTATPISPAAIAALNITDTNTTDSFSGFTPAVNLGWDGFEFKASVNIPNGSACTPEFGDLSSTQFLAAQLDELLVSNPRMVRCGNLSDPPDGCSVMVSLGDYPLGGLLPSDITYSGGGKQCDVFLVNANLSNSEPGQFCGFQSPLSNVTPIAGTFSSGQNLALKFKLALAPAIGAPGDCQNGPFITDAVALLSVAQLLDKQGNPAFNPIPIESSGSSTPIAPTFKIDSNKQYQFSLSLQGYAPGTYSITITFLSSNAPSQTVLIKVL